MESEARDWNRTAPDRWRRLHRRAYQLTKRDHPGLWMVVRIWEMQHRGVLHAHPVLATGTPAQLRAATAYITTLAALAPRYGFGYVDRKLERMSANAAAAYLSAYFVRGKRASLGCKSQCWRRECRARSCRYPPGSPRSPGSR